jgi:hypothetical protein
MDIEIDPIALFRLAYKMKPYEINYSSDAYRNKQYQSSFHAKADRVKDCMIWAWVFEYGTGFESYELTDNREGNLIS